MFNAVSSEYFFIHDLGNLASSWDMHNVKLYGNALGPVYTERQCQRYDNADAPDQYWVANQCKRALSTMLGQNNDTLSCFLL